MRKFFRHLYINLAGSFKSPSNGIHIINSHFINKEVYNKKDDIIFREFLKNINRKATIISIQDALRMLKNDKLIYSAYTTLGTLYDKAIITKDFSTGQKTISN
mgnify:CR=1 FL=1